jgi:signal transduction histidine kinase
VAQQIRNGDGAVTGSDVAIVEEVLNDVVRIIRSPRSNAPDAFVELSRAIEFWSGMCEITLVTGEGVRERVALNPEASESLVVTCLEAINNAVRHGEATRIDVSITFAEVDVLRVVISSNGAPIESPTPGLGMTMYDDLTIEWSLSTELPTTFTGYISARVRADMHENIPAI